ncbi:uncharacterized protein LOC107013272 [Solanum pennellii]|uniref:Uncharacterized protein LOC107013272 n=1 Tax=Solanum pennellii TaxID=28526 RepID=A0ABM1GBK1_SOLPN|nr:uncharacterized protein LOC107013272 [Solanum pennellii]
MLPIPTPLNSGIISAGVAVGGMEGGKELPINVQAGVNTGRGDMNVSKNMDDTISVTKQTGSQIDLDTEGFNNKSGSRMSKKKRDNIKKKQQNLSEIEKNKNIAHDDYEAINSEDEWDPDNQSMYDSEDDEPGIDNPQGTDLVPKSQNVWSQELQDITEKSINTKSSLERIQTLRKLHHLSLIVILEPFANNNQLNIVRMQLQMDHAISNSNGKIWLLWSKELTVKILEIHDQHITGEFELAHLHEKFLMSCIYAECKEHLRRPLWDRLMYFSNLDMPWCTIGDFNVITSIEEKIGGIPYNINKSFAFISVIEACGLTDLGYNGIPFTWCNQKDANARVWKRLDRAIVNDKWLENMPQTTIEHLSAVGSDHSPLLMEIVKKEDKHIKYFNFLNCWVDNPCFMDTVQKCWELKVNGNPFWQLHQKLKRLSSSLSVWSKNEYEDIFAKVRVFEDLIKKAEEEFLIHKTDINRQDLQRLMLSDDQIAKAACEYYHNIFTGQTSRVVEWNFHHIPKLITSEQNQMLHDMPTMDELKQVIFAMNPNSAPGPDGIGGKFYQACWNIIKNDLLAAVQYFFCGHVMPKYMSHACLVLIPKIVQPNRFTDLRPISLSNFTNKIISKLLSMRLAKILPSLISDNQLGFVKGRCITENIMLAQEIIHEIKKPQLGNNAAIKLDMTRLMIECLGHIPV